MGEGVVQPRGGEVERVVVVGEVALGQCDIQPEQACPWPREWCGHAES